MTRRHGWGWLVCSVTVLLGLIGLDGARVGAAVHQAKADRIGLGAGYRPPPFSARDLSSKEHSLDEYQGTVLVLHFWASWCPYCRGEIPKLKELQEHWTSRGVRVLAISTDENPDTLKQFVMKQELPYPIIVDAQSDPSVAEQYGISGIPVTYVIAQDGRIFTRLNGSSDILGTVERALAASPSSS